MQRPIWYMSGMSRCWCFRLSSYASSGYGNMYSAAESNNVMWSELFACCIYQ